MSGAESAGHACLQEFASRGEVVPLTPEELRGIEIVKHLGEGGFGEVFEGRFRGGPVAVKRVKREEKAAARDPLTLNTFYCELSVLARFKHPNIVNLIAACDTLPDLVLVLEKCEFSLRDLIEGCGPLDAPVATKIALDVARGALFLLSGSPPVVYADLKSPNVLLTEALDVKLSDFGLAVTQRGPPGTAGGPPPGMPAQGTLLWMAPEGRQGAAPSEKGDVYSFGLVVHEMCSKQLPPKAGPPRLDLVRDAGLREVVRRCVREEPGERPGFQELVLELERLALRHDTAAAVRRLARRISSSPPIAGVGAGRPDSSSGEQPAGAATYSAYRGLELPARPPRPVVRRPGSEGSGLGGASAWIAARARELRNLVRPPPLNAAPASMRRTEEAHWLPREATGAWGGGAAERGRLVRRTSFLLEGPPSPRSTGTTPSPASSESGREARPAAPPREPAPEGDAARGLLPGALAAWWPFADPTTTLEESLAALAPGRPEEAAAAALSIASLAKEGRARAAAVRGGALERLAGCLGGRHRPLTNAALFAIAALVSHGEGRQRAGRVPGLIGAIIARLEPKRVAHAPNAEAGAPSDAECAARALAGLSALDAGEAAGAREAEERRRAMGEAAVVKAELLLRGDGVPPACKRHVIELLAHLAASPAVAPVIAARRPNPLAAILASRSHPELHGPAAVALFAALSAIDGRSREAAAAAVARVPRCRETLAGLAATSDHAAALLRILAAE